VHESKSVVVSDDETQVLVFIAGYVGRKVKLTTNCLACVCELVTEKLMTCDVGTDRVIYTHALDRGGLTWPTQMLVDIVVRIFMVFQRLLCSEYESRFMALSSNKQVAIEICVDLFKDEHSVAMATN